MKLIFSILMRQMPFYHDIYHRKVVYWLSNIGVSLLSPKE
jgi:MFS transporter, ACS family, pantothenate transporter